MDEYERERFLTGLEELKTQFVEMSVRSGILQSAVESTDQWGVPDADIPDGQYSYIPISTVDFVKLLVELDTHLQNDADFRHRLQKYRPFSFLEIGCGIGRNLNLVTHQDHLPVAKAVGFDVVDAYIEAAQKIYGLGENVFVGDCMKFDYSGFDVVYFYRPFSDEKAERKFEKYIISGLKKGAIVIGALADTFSKSRELMPVGESGQIFKKL